MSIITNTLKKLVIANVLMENEGRLVSYLKQSINNEWVLRRIFFPLKSILLFGFRTTLTKILRNIPRVEVMLTIR